MGIDYLENAYSLNRQGEYYDDNAPRVIYLITIITLSYRQQTTDY